MSWQISGGIICCSSPPPPITQVFRDDWTNHLNRRVIMGVSVLMMLVSSLAFHIVPQSHTAAATTCVSPPASVDNTTLSNTDLLRYGLPLRGTMSMTKWKLMIGNAKHRTCLHEANNNISQHLGSKHAPQSGKIPFAQINQYSWAGYKADGADGPYTEADAVFYVPTVTTIPNYAEDLWTWVGVGGFYGPLVQAGVVQSNNDSYVGPTPNYAFYENYPSEIEQTINCPTNNPHSNTPCIIAPGDRMQVEVKYTNYFYVGDGTQQWYFSLQGGGPNASETTAEWIVEYPDCPTADIMKFQPITFYGMGDTESNGTYTGPYWQTNDYYTLLQCVSPYSIAAYPGPLIYNTTYGPPNNSNTITWNSY